MRVLTIASGRQDKTEKYSQLRPVIPNRRWQGAAVLGSVLGESTKSIDFRQCQIPGPQTICVPVSTAGAQLLNLPLQLGLSSRLGVWPMQRDSHGQRSMICQSNQAELMWSAGRNHGFSVCEQNCDMVLYPLSPDKRWDSGLDAGEKPDCFTLLVCSAPSGTGRPR